MEYYAKIQTPRGKTAIQFFTEGRLMDHYLSKGMRIYACEEGKEPSEKDLLIATPEDGYLVERPELPESERTRREDEE